MRLKLGTLLALWACSVLCMTSGCASMGGIAAKSDNNGGVVVYDTHGPHPRAVGRLDAEGNRFTLPPQPGDIRRGAGGMDVVEEALERASKAGHGGGVEAWEWALAWTIVYLIVILIELAIAEAEDAD